MSKDNEKLRNENSLIKQQLNCLNEKLNKTENATAITKANKTSTQQQGVSTELDTDEKDSFVVNISTFNRFNPLTDRKKIQKKKSHEVMLVIDSHGNGIVPKRAFEDVDFNLSVLGPGKKNISGIKEFIDEHETPKHLIIGVGNNDLSNKPFEECKENMQSLVDQLSNLTDCNIHFLQCFERVGQDHFNRDVSKRNHFLKETCNHYGNFHYLSNLPLMSSLST